jgi:hypothetical protein
MRAVLPGKRWVIALCAFFLAGAVLGTSVEGKPRRGKGKRALAGDMCRTDVDCALVTDGCCSCNEGGKQRAVAAKSRRAYEKRRREVCKQIMCPALMSEDPSCVAPRAVCKDGICALGI